MSKFSVNGTFVVSVPQSGAYDERAMRTFVSHAVTKAGDEINACLPQGVKIESFAAHTIVPFEEGK